LKNWEKINTRGLHLHNLLTSHQDQVSRPQSVAADLQTPPDDELTEDVVLDNVADVAFRDEQMVIQPVMLKYLIMQREKIGNFVAFTHGTKEEARKMLGDSAWDLLVL
jgi:hypothetical protein